VVEAPPVDEVGERRVGHAAAVVQRLEVRAHGGVALAAGAQQPEPLLDRRDVGEEQPQQRLVPELVTRLDTVQPAEQRGATRLGDPVRAPPPAVCGGRLAGDPAGSLEASQLRVDLAVAGGPEMADGAVDRLLQVVAAPRPLVQEAEQRPGDGGELHVSR